MLRFAVLWRKRSLGTASEKGDRWVERILSLSQTCRIQKRLTYAELVNALEAYFNGTQPEIEWVQKLDPKGCVRLRPWNWTSWLAWPPIFRPSFWGWPSFC